jgi:hypothetical protein
MRARPATLLAMVLVTMMLVAAPALADQGGNPDEESCGLGSRRAHEAIEDETSPGATECAPVRDRAG